jgi:subtilisin family serine protease
MAVNRPVDMVVNRPVDMAVNRPVDVVVNRPVDTASNHAGGQPSKPTKAPRSAIMLKPRLGTVAIVAVALVLPPALASPAKAGSTPVATKNAQVAAVTLITGDRVTVRDGRVLSVAMGARRKAQRYWQHSKDGHDYVVPMDAAKALASGRLDQRLFDVTGLVEQGYDDRHRRDLPVIIEASPTARAAAPRAAKVNKDLRRVGMLSLTVPKNTASDFWAGSAGGRIWLDGTVRASLDQSVPQTGAPQAWQAGYRADGVKVAVLDTGVDATHPDLAGRIAATENFSDAADAVDHNGHGTHVASTISGSGAASGGRYQGMAPGAKLLVGKVLGDGGSGSESAIIAGMQWATQQGARVVNMSLGGRPTDGFDPLSQAVDELTESTGALFVVAAGNTGADNAVGSPATADRALAVASVTKSGQLSVFSSRGPRRDNYGLKPEIAGPGSDIVAARAAGTLAEQSVNTRYAKLSGTSMASPHVAGAAAIVAGQHPDWRADRIKAALVGSAAPIEGANVFGQGAGVVNVARAVNQRVMAEPATLGLGQLSSDDPARADAVYRNDGDAAVELTVALRMAYRNGTAAPAGLFGLDRQRLVVPAKGSAKLALRVTPKPGQAGQFVGTITATAHDVSLITPAAVALYGAEPSLTVNLRDRDGNPALANVAVQNEATGESFQSIVAGGVFARQVPTGRYRVIGQTLDGAFEMTSLTTFALPAVQVSKDTEVSVDAAPGKPVTVSVDDPTARPEPSSGGTGVVSTVDGQNGRLGVGVLFGGGPSLPMYAVGSPTMAGLAFGHVSVWQRPWTTVTVTGPAGFEIPNTLEQSRAGWRGTVTGRLVDVGDASEDPGDLHGKVPLFATPDDPSDEEKARRMRMLKDRGAAVVLAQNYVADQSILPIVQVFDIKSIDKLRDALSRGPVNVRVDGRRDSPYAYFNGAIVPGRVPDGHAFRFERAKMGRVDSTFASVKATDDFNYLVVNASSPSLNAGFELNTRWPQRRTDYYSPGFSWQSLTAISYSDEGVPGYEITSPLALDAGERRTRCMSCGPFGPELADLQADRQTGQPLPWAYREGDKLTFAVPMIGSRDPATFTSPDPSIHGSTVLTANGKRLGTNDAPGTAVFDIPAGSGRYTVVSDATRSSPEWPLATRTRAEWTFLAPPAGDRTALPLLDLRYDLPLSDYNTAPAGVVAGYLDARHQPGAAAVPIRSVGAQVSFDDGATWRAVPVTRDGARWKAQIPAGTGFATLRATAVDTMGNRTTETVTRAYQVR